MPTGSLECRQDAMDIADSGDRHVRFRQGLNYTPSDGALKIAAELGYLAERGQPFHDPRTEWLLLGSTARIHPWR